PSSQITTLAWIAFAGLGGFVFSELALHGLQPVRNPLHEAISYYWHGRQGWLLAFGLIALGVAALALSFAAAEYFGKRPGVGGLRLCGNRVSAAFHWVGRTRRGRRDGDCVRGTGDRVPARPAGPA
ncbi:MAG TPA: hypothetical protein VGD13_08205, partial [Xanthobacteraceae bacterium]